MAGQATIRFRQTGSAEFASNVTVGSKRDDGDLIVTDKNGKTTIHLNGQDGDMYLKDKNGNTTIHIVGETGNAYMGGNGQEGKLLLSNRYHQTTIELNGGSGNVVLGGNGQTGQMYLQDQDGKTTIHVDGGAGDIILQNADCAEDFDIQETEKLEPGTVVVFNQAGKLQQNIKAYDTKVAGVISGAGGYKPGIVLDKKRRHANNRMPLALMGKVYCKVEAESSPIEIGNLLTTSAIPGHAMMAIDPIKAFGAVIGKALQPLQSGRSLIPILVTLQ